MPLQNNLLNPELFPAQKGPPHPLFDAWRRDDPVHWNPPNPDYRARLPDSLEQTRGFWVLTRYDDVTEASLDQERFSSYQDGFVVWDFSAEGLARQRANFMGMKPSDHAAVRKAIMPPFLPRALAGLEASLEQIATEIVDGIEPAGRCEFVFDVAAKLPIYTFCELMGIPPSLRAQVADYGNALADVESRHQASTDPLVGLAEICNALAVEKRARPDDRLMSALVNDAELNLSPLQLNQFFVVFAMAGHETTRSTAAHFVDLMHRHPDQRRLLDEDFEGRIDNALDEVLRYTSTTTNFRRTATRDTKLGDRTIKAGDKVYLSYAAANRDPSVFIDPHRFDILRENARRHIAFGIGPHVCIGARLARMQLKALLREVCRRLPDLRPEGEPTWLRSIWFNAIVDMPVTFSPAGRA